MIEIVPGIYRCGRKQAIGVVVSNEPITNSGLNFLRLATQQAQDLCAMEYGHLNEPCPQDCEIRNLYQNLRGKLEKNLKYIVTYKLFSYSPQSF